MKIRQKKVRKILKLIKATAYIKTTLNNTIITITDNIGKAICWSAAGVCGFKGTKKSTPFAAQIVAKTVGNKAKEYGITKLDIIFSGQGEGRNSALQSFINSKFIITKLKYTTRTPYNGCRPPKRRKL
jgi:small subunit ribosomal protein S11